jgi:hypothetical protein
VKGHVADDLMMAQRYFETGHRVVMESGENQLSTRMYTSLRELIAGWSKNVFAAGRDAVPMGKPGRALFPMLLLAAPLSGFFPAMILVASIFNPLSPVMIRFAWIAQIAQWIWWAAVYIRMRQSPLYALLSPVGAVMTFYIFARAVARGDRVMWKGRSYVSR